MQMSKIARWEKQRCQILPGDTCIHGRAQHARQEQLGFSRAPYSGDFPDSVLEATLISRTMQDEFGYQVQGSGLGFTLRTGSPSAVLRFAVPGYRYRRRLLGLGVDGLGLAGLPDMWLRRMGKALLQNVPTAQVPASSLQALTSPTPPGAENYPCCIAQELCICFQRCISSIAWDQGLCPACCSCVMIA